ncbi:hypothetical protein [Aeoliella mucimassa]|nr:hypothetical protein [Aeoliella mucimassa]
MSCDFATSDPVYDVGDARLKWAPPHGAHPPFPARDPSLADASYSGVA